PDLSRGAAGSPGADWRNRCRCLLFDRGNRGWAVTHALALSRQPRRPSAVFALRFGQLRHQEGYHHPRVADSVHRGHSERRPQSARRRVVRAISVEQVWRGDSFQGRVAPSVADAGRQFGGDSSGTEAVPGNTMSARAPATLPWFLLLLATLMLGYLAGPLLAL